MERVYKGALYQGDGYRNRNTGKQGAEEGEIQQDETEQYGKFKSLTRDVVEQWIDCIYVYGKAQFDIVFL